MPRFPYEAFLAALLAAVLVMPRGAWAQEQVPQKTSDGYILHEDMRSGEETLYYFQVRSDTSVLVRRGRDADAPAIILPRLVAKILSREVEEDFPIDSSKRSRLVIGYEDQALVVGLAQRLGLWLVAGLALFSVTLLGLALWLWRRLSTERRRRLTSEARRQSLAEGREKERRRLAREIHDGPVQDLHGLHMRLASVRAVSNGEGDNGELDGGELMRITRELRAMSADLHPPALARFGLAAALRAHAGRLAERHPDLHVQLVLDEDPEHCLSKQVRLALFRVAQEAMSNAAQHAQAQSVRVRLTTEENTVRLEIEDDGRGFEVPRRPGEKAQSGHYGLLGMKERTDAIGATLNVTSAPEKGTTVRVDAPCPTVSRSETSRRRAARE